jgi:hypothetical protein
LFGVGNCLLNAACSIEQPTNVAAAAAAVCTKIAVNLLGAVVDGVLVGGSPAAQAATRVNYFDPGRVLVRPPDFMNVQVRIPRCAGYNTSFESPAGCLGPCHARLHVQTCFLTFCFFLKSI